MLDYNRIDLNEVVDVAKSNNSNECLIFDHWLFNHGFTFQDFVCNGCYNLTIFCLNVSGIAFFTVNCINYCCIIHDISKSDPIHLLEKPVREDFGYIEKCISILKIDFTTILKI